MAHRFLAAGIRHVVTFITVPFFAGRAASSGRGEGAIDAAPGEAPSPPGTDTHTPHRVVALAYFPLFHTTSAER